MHQDRAHREYALNLNRQAFCTFNQWDWCSCSSPPCCNLNMFDHPSMHILNAYNFLCFWYPWFISWYYPLEGPGSVWQNKQVYIYIITVTYIYLKSCWTIHVKNSLRGSKVYSLSVVYLALQKMPCCQCLSGILPDVQSEELNASQWEHVGQVEIRFDWVLGGQRMGASCFGKSTQNDQHHGGYVGTIAGSKPHKQPCLIPLNALLQIFQNYCAMWDSKTL